MNRAGLVVAIAALVAFTLPAQAGVVSDLPGDVADTFGAGPPLLDIAGLSALPVGGDLVVSMTFFTPISAPSSAGPDAVYGFIEFDTDLSALTGGPPFQNGFSPPFEMLPLGIDYYVDFSSESITPGFVDVIDTGLGPVGSVPISFGPSILSLSIPLAMLGGDDGIVDQTAIVGTFHQPTDAIGGLAIPEPSSAVLLGFGLLAVAGYRLRRKRRS